MEQPDDRKVRADDREGRGHAEPQTKWLHGPSLHTPPPFEWGGGRVVPVNISEASLVVTINVPARRAEAAARLRFRTLAQGQPLLDLVPNPTRVALDGAAMDAASLREVRPPEWETRLRVLTANLAPDADHTLELTYPLSREVIRYSAGGIGLACWMNDWDERDFFEVFAPSNLEFDQHPYAVEFRLEGATAQHKLYTNGAVLASGPARWLVEFPAYFTCSSYFLHLTDLTLVERRAAHTTADGRRIEIVAYGSDATVVAAALERAAALLPTLERDYGPYLHDRLVIYMAPPDSGAAGMEYCGATITTRGALEHEIFHSWFARGVMPANGNAGWMDEAIATWRDQGYPTADPARPDPVVNQAGWSPYRRGTPKTAYKEGALLLSKIDRIFGRGLKAILGKWFMERRGRVVTTDEFLDFLRAQGHAERLNPLFRKYVYGQSARAEDSEQFEREADERAVDERLKEAWGVREIVQPPRPFTREELRGLL